MSSSGQFEHPLVLRAKLEISAACHAFGKTPSHCVVTEFKDEAALQAAATAAARKLGYTRMWSIHPSQVRVIVDAFAPSTAEVDLAIEILLAAQSAGWAPIRHRDTLHDRASYGISGTCCSAPIDLLCRWRPAAGRGPAGPSATRRLKPLVI
jgi:citrate lyase subunit beta/citryl-CoA lyase